VAGSIFHRRHAAAAAVATRLRLHTNIVNPIVSYQPSNVVLQLEITLAAGRPAGYRLLVHNKFTR
jgi:hypothetical protein